MDKMLVIGANGFLGAHVTRQLVDAGHEVRVMVRRGSDLRSLDGVPVERHYGDIFDESALTEAMRDRDVVFYCVVDTRCWLRDPAPLFRTNVEGLRRVLNVAAFAELRRFIFTSTIGTIARCPDGLATEDLPFNWKELGGAYIQSRVEAENLVLYDCIARGLPAVAMCVANTYGPRDWQPTPHGALVAAAARGKLPFYVNGIASEAVGVEDAARALILAAEKGRIGQRYIVSERFISAREIYEVAADAVGARRPRLALPRWVMYALGAVGNVARHLLRRDLKLITLSVRLMHIMTPMDHGKAMRELGWQPRPVEESIRAAARFYRAYDIA